MQENEYLKRVLETESKPESLAINAMSLDMVFALGMATGEVMNRVKRAMFYGKPLEKQELLEALYNLEQTASVLQSVVYTDQLQDPAFGVTQMISGIKMEGIHEFASYATLENVNKRLLHGAIGEMSETAEKFEALRGMLSGDALDIANYGEELGDSDWYKFIQVDELQLLANAFSAENELPVFDCSPAAIRARNIAKLEKRNKGRAFNAEATVNRDTDAEREILETASVTGLTAALAVVAEGEQQESSAVTAA